MILVAIAVTLTRTSRNQEGNVFFGKKKFSAVRGNLDDPPIHVPQNVPALAGLNEITFVGSSLYGIVIFIQKIQFATISCQKMLRLG